MLNKHILIVALLIFCGSLNAQEITIIGEVKSNDGILESALVELLDANNKRISSAVTNTEGKFNFQNKTVEDSIFSLKIHFYGYKEFLETYSKDDVSSDKSLFILLEENSELLSEVVVEGDKITEEVVTKSVFDINRYDFRRNEVATGVLNTIPSVSYDKVNGILVDNRDNAKIYIDGLESSIQNFNSLEVKEIDKVELIKNPSARFGSEFTGAIINILTKEPTNTEIKGRLSGGVGLLRKSYTFFPSLALKSQKVTIRTNYNLLDNKQEINYDLFRISFEDSYNLKSYKEPNIIQESGGLSAKINVGKKATLYTDFSAFITKEEADQVGFEIENSEPAKKFLNREKSDFQRFNLNLSFLYNLTDRDEFIFKSKGYLYRRNNRFFIDREEPFINDTKSSMDEISLAADYIMSKRNVSDKAISYTTGIKFIDRNYNTSPDDFQFNQQIFSGYFEFSVDLNNTLSNFTSIQFENTFDKNSNTKRNYFNFLPTFILQQKLKKNYTLKYSFSKRIKRPSVYYLNDALIYLNPGVANRGNQNLKPQLNYSNNLSLSKLIGKSYLNMRVYYDHTDNAIVYNNTLEEETLISFYDNIGKVDNIGISTSFRHNLFGKIRTNISSGVSYDKYSSQTESLNQINDGFSYSGSISGRTSFLNDKLSLDFYLRYNNRIYDLTTKTENKPYTYLRLSTNIIKNRINLSLLYSDLFNIYSERSIETIDPVFNQKVDIVNRLSNITLGISYNFGKKFNDYFKTNNIDNSDLLSD